MMSGYDEALTAFATYAGLLTLKWMFLGPLTSLYRVIHKVYLSPEDYRFMGLTKMPPEHPTVERVRGCSRNDQENIIPFVILGALFARFSGLPLSTVVWHYRVFAASRFFHTVAYLAPLPQPCRATSYVVGLVTNISMAYTLLSNVWNL